MTEPFGNTSQDLYSISVAGTVEEVEEIRDIWESMQWHYRGNIDFYLAELQSENGNARPHVMLLRREGQPVSMLVGRIENQRLAFRIGYKVVYRPKASSLVILSGGILGDTSPSNAEVLVKDLLDTLYRGEVDLVLLCPVRTDSPIYQLATSLPRLLYRGHFHLTNVHRKLLLTSDIKDFYQKRSRNTRNSTRRLSKRLQKEYGDRLTIKCFDNEKDLDVLMHDMEQVASKSWQRGLGVGYVNDDKYRTLLKLASQHNWLRVYVLYIDGNPSAFWHGYLYKGTFHIDIPGYNNDYRSLKIGTYLMVKMIEDLIQKETIQAIDYGLDDAQYKRSFSDESWEDSYIYLFSPRLRGLRINLIRKLIIAIDQTAKWVLDRTGLLQKAKSTWRRLKAK